MMREKKHRVTCEQCDGDGYIVVYDDYYELQHDCYRCMSTGYHDMSDEEYVEYVNELIADSKHYTNTDNPIDFPKSRRSSLW